MPWYDSLLAKGILPDPILRMAMRRLNKNTLNKLRSPLLDERHNNFIKLIDKLKHSPIALNVDDANKQHYEFPSDFFQLVLGKRLKYSCCYWPNHIKDLNSAENAMLELTAERAQIQNGHKILDLGCGWGSFSLYIAEQYPDCHITSVSNSKTQKKFIESIAAEKHLDNVSVKTMDVNNLALDTKFDRIVSIEMFEHVRNYAKLLNLLYGFLKDDGKLFVHIFSHKDFAYLFDSKEKDSWITKYFFTGGIMPSDNLLFYFIDKFTIENHWRINGKHYYKTCNEWLKKMDCSAEQILSSFRSMYPDEALKLFNYWRIFFMACAELFGFNRGNEWIVSHYLFKK